MFEELNSRIFDTPFFAKDLFEKRELLITDETKSFKVELAAPGINKKLITLKTDGNELVLSYKSDGNTRSKFGIQSFTKYIKLTDTVDVDGISANYVDGIITVDIPKKKKEISSKTIEVK